MDLQMPVRPQTDARRKAAANYHSKREADGLSRSTVWFTPDAKAKLDALKAEHGLSMADAVNAAIMAFEPSKS